MIYVILVQAIAHKAITFIVIVKIIQLYKIKDPNNNIKFT